MSRGYFAIGLYVPKFKENIGTLWRSASLFGASFIFTIGDKYKKDPMDTPDTIKHIPLFHYKTYEEFVKKIPRGASLILIEKRSESVSLERFVHPERGVYLLGSESQNLGLPEHIQGDACIEIPTSREYSLNVAVSGSIVMFDRYVKTLRTSVDKIFPLT